MAEIKKSPEYDSMDDLYQSMGLRLNRVQRRVRYQDTLGEEEVKKHGKESARSFQSRWKHKTGEKKINVILKVKRYKKERIEKKIKKKIEIAEIERESNLDDTAILIKKRDKLKREIDALKCKKKN